MRQGGTADAKLGQQWSGQADHPQPEEVSPCFLIALHVAGFVQAAKHPGDRALVQANELGDLRDAQEGTLGDGERFENREGATSDAAAPCGLSVVVCGSSMGSPSPGATRSHRSSHRTVCRLCPYPPCLAEALPRILPKAALQHLGRLTQKGSPKKCTSKALRVVHKGTKLLSKQRCELPHIGLRDRTPAQRTSSNPG